MKRFIAFIKNNWMFLFLIIPFIFICINNKFPDNDIWFLLNNGRYVFNHGIPTIDPFTIHEGLEYVMQQWGSASLFWGLFNLFGKEGLLIFIYIITILLLMVFYKLCHTVSDNKTLSIFLTCVTFYLCRDYIVLRPQVITYLILILEILVIELYIKKKNVKYLYVLPLLSILLINLHASMWYFLFVFMLPFLLNCINIKGLIVDRYRIKPLLIAIFFMVVVGFINPYGYKALTFIFKSYGLDAINEHVGEMKPLSFEYIPGKVVALTLIFVIFMLFVRKDLKLDIRHFLFISGATLLGFMHQKCYPIFMILVVYCIAYYFRKFKIKFEFNILDNKIFKALYRGMAIGVSIVLIFSFVFTSIFSLKSYQFRQEIDYITYTDTVDYILEHYDKDDVRLYVDFNNGGYTEYRGLKSYIDGRAELFFKKFNGKDDIFEEFYEIENNNLFDFDKFMNKYDFTHLIVMDSTNFDFYLRTNEEYEVKYNHYLNVDDEFPILKLYVNKNVEVLE